MVGKPRADRDTVRTENVLLRVTSDEKRAYTDAAEKDGRSVSDWLRWLAARRVARLSKR
jgi:hypothetical protein